MSSNNSGGMTCSVATCRSSAKWKRESGEHISFHRFPKDPQLRKEWIRMCYRKDVFNPESKRICSRHFHKQDFEDLCHASIMNVAPKKLKSTALPCLNLKSTSTMCSCSLRTPPSTITSNRNRNQRAVLKEQKQIVSQLLVPNVSMEPQITEAVMNRVKQKRMSLCLSTKINVYVKMKNIFVNIYSYNMII